MYSVEINFKKEPTFQCLVTADDQRTAEKKALQIAAQCGFHDQVKKIITKPN